MSSYGGGGFAEWLRDSYAFDVSDAGVEAVRGLLGSEEVSGIEAALAAYSEEERSWRDYRNAIWHRFTDEESDRIAAAARGGPAE